jgi:hypothetical protein
VAVAGVASAEVTYTIDNIQANGDYIGTPKINSTNYPQCDYEYIFYPDGTYTIFGTITNDGDTSSELYVDFYSEAHWAEYGWDRQIFNLPANSKIDYTMTAKAESVDDLAIWFFNNERSVDDNVVDLSGVDFSNVPDLKQHTIDQGPMSDLVVVLANGVFDFGSSITYSFAQ